MTDMWRMAKSSIRKHLRRERLRKRKNKKLA